MMKEVEVDPVAMLWVNARVAHFLSVHRMMNKEVGDGLEEEPNPDGYGWLMYTQNAETIEPFSSHVIPVKARRPTQENASTSWHKPCELKMAHCCRASLYRTCTPS